ncbi:LuxR family transcriptional regulator [Bradyrhizobium sp. AUGA SZCCT0176]|uniref:helix-turn-helix transcriptional regulator n=1 Tax=unclassified Bradyrhizobium TaxID=2631580 RepID=UPI001BA7427A|nr:MULTISPECIES: LuxR family transcriptional regulator [unclassified Bradyrhizobium]MBR1225194.1 LuxR family transcriptional regulator [Bradyrhizobium sp. AUGA SZCCT0176]MBR1281283.1 LuxR family transcriptional regulator [Bradyrhizobium sp. AUGA SZCCT0177]
MITTIEEFIDKTRDASSASQLKDLFLATIREEGYENAVFARAQNKRLISIPWSEFPLGYLDTYRAEQWDRIDPVVQHIHTARGPFSWSETCDPGQVNRAQRNFFEECRELGVHSGITIPMRGPARETDLISLSFRQNGTPAVDKTAHIYMVCVQYWLKYCELIDRRELPAVALTAQEIECLKWCKEGKTNWEIGEILGISQKTVEFHVGNTMKKLGAGNRITAVIMGIKHGIVSL